MISYKNFSQIDLDDPFFDSLKADYTEFPEWFNKKKLENAEAYVYEDKGIHGFLYLKIENEEITDVSPILPAKLRVKVGTFKVNPHGTRLGERFLKKIFDYAVIKNIDEIYVTVFDKHPALIALLSKFGFDVYGTKTTMNGTENVMIKIIGSTNRSITESYPVIKINNTGKFLLSIYPQFHSRLFPDSILSTESYDLIKDVSHTNSIFKIYICYMDLSQLQNGDNIIIYRTTDYQGPAAYRSVATSICVVDEIKTKRDFANVDDYLQFCRDYSVFSDDELKGFYSEQRANFFVLRMTYNVAFKRRIIRKQLIEEVGISQSIYWGFFRISDTQFIKIIELGEVDAGIIVD